MLNISTAIAPAVAAASLPIGINKALENLLPKMDDRKDKEKLVDLDKCFFIFDDLERCSVPISDAMGYINNLIEHNDCKVLIVANEEECMPPSSSAASATSDQGNARYLAAKEKLVGITIKYRPQPETVISELVKKINPELDSAGSGLSAEDVTGTCLKVMNSEGTDNLRILQFALAFFKKLYDILQPSASKDYAEAHKETLLTLLEAVLRVAIRSRVKGKGHKWDVKWPYRETAYGEVNCLPGKNGRKTQADQPRSKDKSFFSFRFVHEYMTTGVFKKDEAPKALEAFLSHRLHERILMESYTVHKELFEAGWYDFENATELTELLVRWVNNFRNYNNYSALQCLQILYVILSRLQKIPELGDVIIDELNCTFEEFPDILFSSVMTGVANGNVFFDSQEAIESKIQTLPLQFGELDGEYHKKLERYKSDLYKAKVSSIVTKMKLNDCFDAENWSDRFYEIVTGHHQEIRKGGKFCVLLDVGSLATKLKNSCSSKDYKNIHHSFVAIYSDTDIDHYFDDKENLEKLLAELENTPPEDPIVNGIYKYFLEFLYKFLGKKPLASSPSSHTSLR